MNQIYLSRRNLVTLLEKLNGVKNGLPSACTLIKRDIEHPVYPQTMEEIRVTAVEDEDYYTDRPAGVTREDLMRTGIWKSTPH